MHRSGQIRTAAVGRRTGVSAAECVVRATGSMFLSALTPGRSPWTEYWRRSRFRAACRWLLVALALPSTPASLAAEAGLGLDRGRDPLAPQIDFLPVDEAYRFSAVLDQGRIVARWEIEPGYYLYRSRFGFQPDARATLGEPEIPPGQPKVDEFFGDVEVYYDEVTVVVPVTGQAGSSFSVQFGYQGCADAGLCYPPETRTVTFETAGTSVGPMVDAAGAGADVAAVLAALASAILGGLILNLMPCVFPVLAIKAVSLVEAEPQGRWRHAAGYAAGVVVTFLVLGGVLAALRSAGEAIGWGFQLQSTGFVVAMALVFFLLGLNLLGVLEVPGFGVAMEGSNAFAAGAIAVVVATPCTAPFMGAALGYGIAHSTPMLLLVMAALGFGLALPYVVLAVVPALADRLPRPGPWMATLKQVLAFPLFLTVAWLVWVLGRQAGADAVLAALCACTVLGFCAWLALGKPARLPFVWAAAALVLALTVWLLPRPQGEARESSFDMAAIEQRVAAGEPVLLNFTAAWCITCLANERTTLSTARVKEFLAANGISEIKADWTNADPAITEALGRFGRSGVPLYVFYPPGGEPVLLPQVLSPGIVIETITAAAGAVAPG